MNYRSLFEALPCGVLVVRRKDREIVDCNAHAEVLFGQSKATLCGQPIDAHVANSEQDTLRVAVAAGLGSVGTHWVTPSGTSVPVTIDLNAEEIDGTPVVLCVCRSSTLPQKAAGLDQQTVSHFFSKMGHEMRTPLNAILGYSEMYIEDPDDIDPDELVEDLYKVVESANRLLIAVDQVVALMKDPTATAADYGPAAMIARIEALHKDSSPRRGIKEVIESGGAAGLSGIRVLLVEDHILNQELASELLTEAGLVVTMADNGLQALEILDGQPFDAVLMDIQMPVMDGYAATRKIRELPHFANLPVIAMTAGVTQEDREHAAAAGMDDFIGKPFDIEQTLKTLTRCLNKGP